MHFRIDYSHNGLPGERCQSQFAAVRNAPSAVRQSMTTGFVGMTFGCLAFRLGVREGHLTTERRLPLGYSAQEGE
jgi:hypothetical protein